MSSEPSNKRLLVARPGAVRAMGARWAFWRAQHGCEAHALSQAEAVLLRYAQVFRTEPELLALARDHAGMPGEVAAATLRRLMDLGIVAELDAFLTEGGEDSTPPPPVVVIRTCNRAEGLARLIESIVAHARAEGTVREYVVVDDSLDPTARAAARASAERLRQGVSVPARYFGAEDANALASELARLVPAERRESLFSLLDPGARNAARTGARAWNLALLLSAGRTLSILDDDTVFPLRRPPESDIRFDLSGSSDQEARWFDEPGAPGRLPPVPGDPFEYASRYLGRTPGALLARDGCDRRSVHGRGVNAVSHLTGTARVAGAFTGTYGAIPFDSAVYFNTASASTVDDLLRAPYRHERLQGDDVWQGALRPRILPHAMFTPLLLDNRALRPFAGTFGKSDDTLFLHLMKAMDPEALFVFLAAAIGHYPVEARDRTARSLQPAITDESNFLVLCVSDVLPLLRSSDPAERLAFIGAYFEELARASEARLADAVFAWRDTVYTGIVVRVGEVLERRGDAPEQWRRYAEQVLRVNRDALCDRSLAPEYFLRLRATLRQAADAAAVWPQLWRHCAERG